MELSRRKLLLGIAAAAPGAPGLASSAPGPQRGPVRLQRLVESYPDHLVGVEGDALIWRDGTRMEIGAERPPRAFAEMLRSATIADQLRQPYLPGPPQGPPPPDHSPGRLRNLAFFTRMYGDCRAGEVAPRLRSVIWMPRSRPQRLHVTTVNAVADRLERVIAALEALPEALRRDLVPSAGAYSCRTVADTGLPSLHGFGAAVDIAARRSDYWAWSRGCGADCYRNQIPFEIVECFEAEKFIWGGKWYHFDTMHFEYRPELFP